MGTDEKNFGWKKIKKGVKIQTGCQISKKVSKGVKIFENFPDLAQVI